MKVLLAQINPVVGGLDENREKIIHVIEQGRKKGTELIIFPELCLCGYPPEDLLNSPHFIQAIQKQLQEVIFASKGVAVVLGTVRENPSVGEKGLMNSAAIIENGVLIGFQDKILLPTYDVFYERRYFEPGMQNRPWNLLGKRVAVTICEDIWQHSLAAGYSFYPRDPVLELKNEKIDLLINLSSSPFYIGRSETRLNICQKAAMTLSCPVALCNQVGGNDSLIFDGCSYYVDQAGNLVAQGASFKEDLVFIDTDKPRETLSFFGRPIEDLFLALVLGVRDYFLKLGFKRATLGLSGGIDSAVVAFIALEALGKENVQCVFMPSRYSSEASRKDAQKCAENMGVEFKEISIEEPFESFKKILSPHFDTSKIDVTQENIQSRIRGTILMALSNQFNSIVLSTGNKSEMALGYMTLYGDMCGGLNVLGDVSKRQVYALAKWINREEEIIPETIIEKPPTAELRPNQKDTDTLPPYELLDTVLEEYVENMKSAEEIASEHDFDLALVKDLVRRIHLNEYKRRQAPLALRVTKKAFSAGRRFPIVQKWNI